MSYFLHSIERSLGYHVGTLLWHLVIVLALVALIVLAVRGLVRRSR